MVISKNAMKMSDTLREADAMSSWLGPNVDGNQAYNDDDEWFSQPPKRPLKWFQVDTDRMMMMAFLMSSMFPKCGT